MEYKILVLDIDGTLTNSKKEITPRTRAALKKAQEKGVKIVLASGRPTYGIMPVAKQLELSAAAGDPPEKVARILVETARARAEQTGRPDDITAAVLRLEPCGH